ncbi:extensin-like, partial [Argonauta hians]
IYYIFIYFCLFSLGVLWTMVHNISANFNCPKPYGYFRDPTNCTVFYRCVNSHPYFFTCYAGAVFDEIHDICTWPINVPECLTEYNDIPATTPPPPLPTTTTTTVPPETLRQTQGFIGQNVVSDTVVLKLPGEYIRDDSQCQFIQLTMNVILQALVQGSSSAKCQGGICAVPRIVVVCDPDYNYD